MPSEATNKNSSVYMPAAATNVGKKTTAVSMTSFGSIPQEGDLVIGYPIFSPEYDTHDRLRHLFGKTWTSGLVDGKQNISYPNTGHDITVDRFFIDWYNSFSETQFFPLGQPEQKDSTSTGMFKLLYGETTGDTNKISLQDKNVDNLYTFEYTDQYEEFVKVHIDLNGMGEQFDEGLVKNNFQALFTDSTYSYYNDSVKNVVGGATLKSIVNLDTWFFDYSFSYDEAFTQTELNNLNSLPGALYSNIDVHYSPNFNFGEYRDLIHDNNISEKILPMYYAFPEVAGYLDDENYSQAGMFGSFPGAEDVHGTIFKESIKLKVGSMVAYGQTGQENKYETLENLYNGNIIKKLDGIDHKVASNSDKEIYYKLFSLRMNQFLDTDPSAEYLYGPVHNKISNKYTNICLTDSKKDLLKNYDLARSQYPMSVGINFNLGKKKDLSNTLNKTNMMPPVMAYVSKTYPNAVTSPFVELTEQITINDQSDIADPTTTKQYTLNNSNRKSWDLANIINEYVSNFNSFFDWETQKVTTFISDNQLDFLNPNQSLLKFLFSQTALAASISESNKNFRTYEDILNGDKNDASEILFYRIEKSSAGAVIQNILVPNMSEQDVVNILDTQVKYDKYYEYRVYAYHAVPGTMYKYMGPVEYDWNWQMPAPPAEEEDTAAEACDDDNPIATPVCNELILGAEPEGTEVPTPSLIDSEDASIEATFRVVSQPSIRLIEVPYFNVTNTEPTIVLDKPPVPPDVNIVPFSGIHNKILILLNNSVGDYNLDPIALANGDEQQFSKIRDAQGLGPDDFINFQTDDANMSYQIFKVSKPPLSYADFSFSTPINIDKTSHVDTINPNRKYFYTFRAVDENGHISNPTAVFEVELVTLEDGSDVSTSAILPLIKEYNFPEVENSYAVRDFRKYLLIKPALGQDEINYDKSNIESAKEEKNPLLINPKFGIKEKSIFYSETGNYDPSTNTWTEPSGSLARYKLRVTSKSTGRKIDINFRFTNKRREQ